MIKVENLTKEFRMNKKYLGFKCAIKMMTGIFTPSNGIVSVDGLVPYENRKEKAKNESGFSIIYY